VENRAYRAVNLDRRALTHREVVALEAHGAAVEVSDRALVGRVLLARGVAQQLESTSA